jgi:acetoacetyl-CoA synthetase
VPEVLDSLVIDVQNDEGDSLMPLFVVLREGEDVDESLEQAIRKQVREHCSPRHVPDRILKVDEVPRTLSGKKLEVPVKKILMGTPVDEAASRDSLANPESLDYFVELKL